MWGSSLDCWYGTRGLFWKLGVEGSGRGSQLKRGGGGRIGMVGCLSGTTEEEEALPRAEENSWDR